MPDTQIYKWQEMGVWVVGRIAHGSTLRRDDVVMCRFDNGSLVGPMGRDMLRPASQEDFETIDNDSAEGIHR